MVQGHRRFSRGKVRCVHSPPSGNSCQCDVEAPVVIPTARHVACPRSPIAAWDGNRGACRHPPAATATFATAETPRSVRGRNAGHADPRFSFLCSDYCTDTLRSQPKSEASLPMVNQPCQPNCEFPLSERILTLYPLHVVRLL